MSFSAIAVSVATALVALWCLAKIGGRLPGPYGDRVCQGREWRREFPNAPKADIREFLTLFVDAFAFSGKDKLKFDPSDKILSVYRTLYPSRWMPDALELETLATEVEKRYGFSFSSVWSEDLTLGDLFKRTQESRE
jgi:propanediol dehydratase small subunit